MNKCLSFSSCLSTVFLGLVLSSNAFSEEAAQDQVEALGEQVETATEAVSDAAGDVQADVDADVDAEVEAELAEAGEELEGLEEDAASETDKILEEAEAAAQAEADAKPLTVESMRALVDKGEYEEAYSQGQQMLFDYEGDPEFDLLYGTSAVELGHNQEAIFTFERLLEDEPENIRYKLELARANYQVGEREKAKGMFEEVLVSDQELPPRVEARILAYLNAIASGSGFDDPAKAESLKGFVGLAFGTDSNANASSGEDFVNRAVGLTNVGTFPFQVPVEKEQSTGYLSYQAAGAYVKPFNDKTALDLKVFAERRKNESEQSRFDAGNVFFEIGNRWRFSKGLAKFSLRYTGATLGGADLYDYTSFSASWAQPVSFKFADSLSLGFSTGALRYTQDEASSLDVNPTSFNVGITKQRDRFVHGAGLVLGSDAAQGERGQLVNQDGDLVDGGPSDHISRTYVGLNYTLNYLYDEKTNFYGTLSHMTSSYKEEDHVFLDENSELAKRDGAQTMLILGSRYNWNKSLQFRASLSTQKNTSDIPVYEYSRNKLEVGAGYQL